MLLTGVGLHKEEKKEDNYELMQEQRSHTLLLTHKTVLCVCDVAILNKVGTRHNADSLNYTKLFQHEDVT